MALFYDSQLLLIDGTYSSQGANFAVNSNDIAYVVPDKSPASAGSSTLVDVFKVIMTRKNKIGVSQIIYQQNGRTMAQFKSAIDAVAPNSFNTYTSLALQDGVAVPSTSMLYGSSIIVNQNFVKQSYYDGSAYTYVILGNLQPSDVSLGFTGSQIVSGSPSGGYPVPAAINSTATATAAQVATKVITSTSAAGTTITLPTATLLAAYLGAGQGASMELTIDNSVGASTVTIALGAGMTQLIIVPNGGAGALTVATLKVGVFKIYFASATAAYVSRIA